MARVDKGEWDKIRKSALSQCELTTNHEPPYICHRGPKHQGSHLDVDRDTWFDKYKGKWIIMPRKADESRGARGAYHGRHPSAMTTRRGQ
jgi:hypothetical protein